MKEDKPFGILITMQENKFYYDANKNLILKIDNSIVKDFQSFLDRGDVFLNEILDPHRKAKLNEFITRYRNKGFFKNNRPKTIQHPIYDVCQSYIENDIKSLILQVTQQCNLRCRYCSYSGEGMLDREHANSKMSYETAIKAIDYAFQHCQTQDHLCVNFYGGEPTLDFTLIKRCVDYISEQYNNCARYYMTTNFTILTTEIIEFLTKNRFNLTISLDGPKNITDSMRKYKENGVGVFDTVYNNIIKLKTKEPEYFKKYVSINAVIDPKFDYNDIINFFRNNENLKDSLVSSSVMDTSKIDYQLEYSNQYIISSRYNILRSYIDEYIFNERSKDISLVKGEQQQLINKLKDKSEMMPIMHHAGPCVAGSTRLFVTTDGDYFPCEKASGISKALKIGNIDDGIDINTVKMLLNIGKLSEEYCKNCWAIRFCSMCAVQCDSVSENKLSAEEKLNYCTVQKEEALRSLKTILYLNECKKILRELML